MKGIKMACSCSKITSSNDNQIKYQWKTVKPFDTCPICASKHMDYALIKYQNNIHRSIANIYLAYKHLNKNFNQEASQIFNLIQLYFNQNLSFKKLGDKVTKIHQLASNYIDKNEQFQQKQNLNLENTLSDYQKIYLHFIIVNQLYNFEVGYKDVNTPYCIGLLQEASEYANDIIKRKIRHIWKKIQNGQNLDSNDVISFAEDMLYRQKKDKTIK